MSALLFVSAMLTSASAGPVVPGNLEIQITGLNLAYDGSSIFDMRSIAGGGGNPALADPLTSVSFLLNGELVGNILTSNIFADVFIADVGGIPAGGGLVTSGGNGDAFGVDLLTKPTVPGWGLALDIASFQVFYSGSGISMATTGVATSSSFQDLPFNLELIETEPIKIVFSSANLSDITDDGTFLTGFRAAGTGNISGTGIPEPGTLALLGLGMIALARRAKRRVPSAG